MVQDERGGKGERGKGRKGRGEGRKGNVTDSRGGPLGNHHHCYSREGG